jgi:phage shock protein PspC (stress-responsive transcriptional regulator)
MKKTLNINLGGTAFIIDENAFDLLHNYLETLKRKFSNEAERDEILNDIEARIGEMLNQKLADRKEVVSVEDVQQVMDAMGKPEVIAGEETVTENPKVTTSSSYTYAAPIKKRLFRDPDGGKIGGVIAGLCHYFGVNDPLWARLAVVVLCFISFGTVLLIYFLLLLVIPKAQTSAEKLQMKGEPINISTIEREIKDAATRAGDSVNKFVREEPFVEKLWGLFLTIGKGVLKLVAAFFIFIGLIIIFALIAALFGVSFAGNAVLAHAPHLLINNPGAITAFKAGLVFFIGAPVVGLIYAALRLLFGRRTKEPRLKWLLLAAWFVGLILMSYGGMTVGHEFSTKAVKNEELTLMQPTNGTLLVQITDSLGNKLSANQDEEDHSFNINSGGVIINGISLDDMHRIPIGEPALQLMPSTNDSFYVQKSIGTYGRNKGDALTNSGYVIYNFSQRDTVLNLPPYLELEKQGKYRAQDMKLRIAIPEGKFIRFADNIDRWKATVKGDGSYNDTYFANTTWTNQNGKIICVEGENHFNTDKEDDGGDGRMNKHKNRKEKKDDSDQDY